MKKLTPKRKLFCREYLKDLNGAQAAIRAGFSPRTAREQASQLLTIPAIKEKIEAMSEKRAKKVEVEADDILLELQRLGHADVRAMYDDAGCVKQPKDWPEAIARAVASIEVEELFEGKGQDRKWIGYTKKVKFWNKPQALELMGKHKKLFTDKLEVTGNVTLEQLITGEMPKGDKK